MSRLTSSLITDTGCSQVLHEEAQPSEGDTELKSEKNFEAQPVSSSANGLEPNDRPGSPMIIQDSRSSRAGPAESSQMPISNSELDGSEAKQNQQSVNVSGGQMEDVEEEPSRQRSSLMDVSTEQATGRSSSMDIVMSCQRASNVGGDQLGVGKDGLRNHHPLPRIIESSPGEVCEDDVIIGVDKSSQIEEQRNQDAAVNLQVQADCPTHLNRHVNSRSWRTHERSLLHSFFKENAVLICSLLLFSFKIVLQWRILYLHAAVQK